MPSAFQIDKNGVPIVKADPDSDLDYSVVSWLEGLVFTDADWSITPEDGVVLDREEINAEAVTVDGVEYAAGELATAWIKGMTPGTTYTVRLRGTFTGGRIDDRTFKVRCVER